MSSASPGSECKHPFLTVTARGEELRDVEGIHTTPCDTVVYPDKTWSSCLSSGVSSLVHGLRVTNARRSALDIEVTRGLFDWSTIEAELSNIEFTDPDSVEEGVSVISKMASAADEYIVSLSSADEAYNVLSPHLQWTSHYQYYPCILKELYNLPCRDEYACMSSLGIAITYLERFLGDIWLHVALTQQPGCSSLDDVRTQLPYLIVDILDSPEVLLGLGKTAVTFLKLVMGPPSGLNLRNVYWHGFLTPRECPTSLLSLIIVATASLAQLWQETHSREWGEENSQGERYTLRGRRTFVDLSVSESALDDCNPVSPSANEGSHTLAMERDWCIELCRRSHFVLPDRDVLVVLAFDYIQQGLHVLALSCLLPVLENCLRAVFIHSNNHNPRILCADSRVHYTTLDILLARDSRDVVGVDPERENKLQTVLGMGLLHALRDLFLISPGPRLRQMAAHGELGEVSRCLALRTLGVFLACAYHFCVNKPVHPLGRNSNDCSDNDSDNSDDGVALPAVVSMYLDTHYTAVFHPLSRLETDMFNCDKRVQRIMHVILSYLYEDHHIVFCDNRRAWWCADVDRERVPVDWWILVLRYLARVHNRPPCFMYPGTLSQEEVLSVLSESSIEVVYPYDKETQQRRYPPSRYFPLPARHSDNPRATTCIEALRKCITVCEECLSELLAWLQPLTIAMRDEDAHIEKRIVRNCALFLRNCGAIIGSVLCLLSLCEVLLARSTRNAKLCHLLHFQAEKLLRVIVTHVWDKVVIEQRVIHQLATKWLHPVLSPRAQESSPSS